MSAGTKLKCTFKLLTANNDSDEAPPIDIILRFSKIAVTFEPLMGF